MAVFGLLQQLPGHFRSNDLTSRSLPVTWSHVTSFPVSWLPPPASYSLVRSQTHSTRHFWPSTATSRWHPVKLRHFRVTSGPLRSRDIISCHVTASSSEVEPCRMSKTVYASFRPSTATSRWLPVRWRHFRGTCAHLRWRDIIYCNVTAFSCELQHCRKSNAQYMPVIDLQPLPGDFRSTTSLLGHFRSP